MASERTETWSESDSQRFIDRGRFFVPDREEQIAALCGLIPVPRRPAERTGPAETVGTVETTEIVELCCGEGLLAAALLERFPAATVIGYDGSPAMLETASHRLAPHGERFETRLFDLADPSWRTFPRPVHAFVSSLAIHHLDGEGKRRLFADLARALAPGGALAIADLVEPATAEARALAAAAWDESVRRRSLELAGDLAAWDDFRATGWNHYASPEPDPVDMPSPLFDQLRWLAEAGLTAIDVVWTKAGHAIFGGRKPG